MSGIDALILAGGQLKGAPAVDGGKGFISIGGRPMLSYVSEALLSSQCIDRVFIIASEETRHRVAKIDPRIHFLSCLEGASVLTKIESGLRAMGSTRGVVLSAADAPLLTPDAVAHLVGSSLSSGSQLCYPLVDKGTLDQSFPGSQRTYIHLAEGDFTGGNLMFVEAEPMLANLALVEEVYSARKKPFRLVRILGIRFLFKLMTQRLRLDEVSQRCSEIIGANCSLLVSPFAEMGIDVDKPVDVDFISAVLKLRYDMK